jgi:ATP-dependent Clp protease protease subunit
MDKQNEIKKFLSLDFSKISAATQEVKAQEVRIFGEIWENSLYRLDEQLKADSKESLELLVNSGGGSVFDGVAMASLIKRHEGDTTATGLGFVASIATVILLAADKVRLNKDAFFMIHNAWTWGAGDADELRKEADILEKISAQIGEVYLSQIEKNNKLIDGDLKKTRKSIKNMMKNETWLTADEALNLGLIDEIADNDATLKPLTEDQINNLVNKYGASAPKSFLNMANIEDKPEVKEVEETKQTEATFWDNVKNFFKSNPDKIQEIKGEVEKEQEAEKTTEVENAKALLTEAGFIILDKALLEETNNELEALQDQANKKDEALGSLQNEYDTIMSKLKEFEAEFNGPSAKAELEKEAQEPEKVNTRETILNELNEESDFKNSKFFKMLNK